MESEAGITHGAARAVSYDTTFFALSGYTILLFGAMFISSMPYFLILLKTRHFEPRAWLAFHPALFAVLFGLRMRSSRSSFKAFVLDAYVAVALIAVNCLAFYVFITTVPGKILLPGVVTICAITSLVFTVKAAGRLSVDALMDHLPQMLRMFSFLTVLAFILDMEILFRGLFDTLQARRNCIALSLATLACIGVGITISIRDTGNDRLKFISRVINSATMIAIVVLVAVGIYLGKAYIIFAFGFVIPMASLAVRGHGQIFKKRNDL